MKSESLHSAECERHVLGGAMLDAKVLDLGLLDPEDFGQDKHGKLWALLEEMNSRGEPTEMVAVVERIARGKSSPEDFGGLAYVSGLPDNVPSTENCEFYARLVKRDAQKRALLRTLNSTAASLAEDKLTVSGAEAALSDHLALQTDTAADCRWVGDVVGEVFADLESELSGATQVYIPSGIHVLDDDDNFGGITTQGVTLVIGASGMGKTSFLNRIALGMAAGGRSVLLYGTETEQNRRTRDLMCTLAGIDAKRWGTWTTKRAQDAADGLPTDRYDDWLLPALEKMRQAGFILAELPIKVCNSGWTVDKLAAKARQLFRQGKLDVVIADYLQDFVHSPAVPPQATPQTTYASKTLKDLSASLTIPVVVGAQRSGEKSLNPKDLGSLIPQMTDCQHSSAAHQDAEEVYVLYRRDFYETRYPELVFPGPRGCVQLIARKRRTGDFGSWNLPIAFPSKWVGDRPDQWRLAA